MNQNSLVVGQSFQICSKAAKNVVNKDNKPHAKAGLSSKSSSGMQKLRRRKMKRNANSLRRKMRDEKHMSLREKQRRRESNYKRWAKIKRKSTESKPLSTPRRICRTL